MIRLSDHFNYRRLLRFTFPSIFNREKEKISLLTGVCHSSIGALLSVNPTIYSMLTW